MIQVRRGVFETNSSSSHSICIAKEIAEPIPEKIIFHPVYAGRSEKEIPASDYLYAAIASHGQEYCEEAKEIIGEFLDRRNVKYEFQPITWQTDWDYSYECNVDHPAEIRDFTNKILNDENMLACFLFGDSVVYTGEYDDRSMVAEDGEWCYEDVQDENGNWTIAKYKNPYYHPEKYTYYFKGN